MRLLLKKRSMLIAIIGTLVVVGLLTYRALGNKDEPSYQTTKVERGMIISSISASGQIEPSNIAVTTQATGVVKKIYVNEGDVVEAGDKLLEIELDRDGQISKAKAWATYLSAKSALATAKQDDLSTKRDLLVAQIDLTTAKQSELSAQRELTLAKSSLVAAQDAWDFVKDKPQTDSERQQKELALQAAQYAVELAQSKVDNADKNNAQTVEQTNLTLRKELISARAARDAAQAAYDAALESTSTTEAEVKQKEMSLLSAQQAVELAQYKYDNADASNELTAGQTKLSLQREVESAKAALLAAQDAWDAVKNKPDSDADRRQAELALQAARDAIDIAQGKYNLVDANIKKADLGVSIARQKAGADDSAEIQKAKADIDSTWLAYQATLPTVTAPASGRISDLNLVAGMIISGTSSSGSSSSSSVGSSQGGNGASSQASSSGSSSGGQKVAMITSDNRPIATFNVSEVDVVKVKTGQKATIGIDALSGKTFTGKVVGINRTGSVSSGVTTYPVMIQFDSNSEGVQPNMAASASIITETKDEVLLIPSNVSRTQGTQTLATILKNGQTQQIPVTLGLFSDSQAEVVSGLSEGDEVVIETVSSGSQQSPGSSSPFSGGGFPGGGMGGGMMIRR